MPIAKEKFSLGMVVTIVSTIVSFLGLAFAIYSSHINTRERISKTEGIVEQLGKSVFLLEQGHIRNRQAIESNKEAIRDTKQEVTTVKQQTDHVVKKVLPEIRSAVTTVVNQQEKKNE